MLVGSSALFENDAVDEDGPWMMTDHRFQLGDRASSEPIGPATPFGPLT